MNRRRTRPPVPGGVRLLLLDGTLARCPVCQSAMLAVGHFAMDVQDVGEPCDACLPHYVPPELVDLARRLEELAGVVARIPTQYDRLARSLVADAAAALSPGPVHTYRAAAYEGIPEVPSAPDNPATAV